MNTPYRLGPDSDFGAVLRLIQATFAYMEDRIAPPSSMKDLTPAIIAQQAETAEVWAIGAAPDACMFLTPRPGRLYLGKLAVAGGQRGKGLARVLVNLAEERCRALGLPVLELQTRVELTDNQAIFRALGFLETGRTVHAGYDRPTSVTFGKAIVLTDAT